MSKRVRLLLGRLRRLRLAVLLCCILACQSLFQPLHAAPPQALRLQQVHSFLGRCQLTVAENGVRIENTDQSKFVLVAKAPDWRVTVYRTDDKVCFSQSLKDFQATGMISGFVLPVTDRILDPKALSKTKTKLFGYDVTSLLTKKASLKYLERGKIAPQVDEIVFCAYKTPTNGGIPVYYRKISRERDYYTDSKQEVHQDTLIATSKIEAVPYNTSLFTAPVGFKSAKSIQEIVAGSGAKAKTADFQELFEMKSVGSKRR